MSTRGRRFDRRIDAWRWRLRIAWQVHVAPRILRVAFVGRLPWWLWLSVCRADTDTVIREIGRRAGRPLTFVQIGSYDGVTADPLHETVRRHAWRGVVVEPMPEPFRRLEANYSDLPSVRAVRAAIAEDDGPVVMHTVVPQDDDPFWAPLLSSFDPEVIRTHSFAMSNIDDRLLTVTVEGMTLASLVDGNDLDRIDLLHVDAEGADEGIVRQVPFDAEWAPDIIIYEKCHLPPDRHAALSADLRSVGYRVVQVWPDEVACRRGALRRR